MENCASCYFIPDKCVTKNRDVLTSYESSTKKVSNITTKRRQGILQKIPKILSIKFCRLQNIVYLLNARKMYFFLPVALHILAIFTNLDSQSKSIH